MEKTIFQKCATRKPQKESSEQCVEVHMSSWKFPHVNKLPLGGEWFRGIVGWIWIPLVNYLTGQRDVSTYPPPFPRGNSALNWIWTPTGGDVDLLMTPAPPSTNPLNVFLPLFCWVKGVATLKTLLFVHAHIK